MALTITGGFLKGRKIHSNQKSSTVRPTSSKVREALNNILRPYLSEASFCDLFAGNGTVGLEAASQGSYVSLVEKHPATFKILKRNVCDLKNTYPEIPIQCHQQDAYLFHKKSASFDIVFADPPFTQSFDNILSAIQPLIKPDGIGVIQYPSRQPFLGIEKASNTRIYGESSLAFFYNK